LEQQISARLATILAFVTSGQQHSGKINGIGSRFALDQRETNKQLNELTPCDSLVYAFYGVQVGSSNQAKIQHYVPRFILKNFGTGKKCQVYVFDKHQEKVFTTNIRNAATEQGFYELNVEGVIYSIEPSLGNIETEASKILRTIVITKALARLSNENKWKLSEFVAVQLARVNRIRQSISEMNRLLEEKLRHLGADPTQVKGFDHLSDEDIKAVSLDILVHYHNYVPHIFEKTWVLFETSKSNPFYTSDNPVTLQNMYDFSPRSNLGLAVKGIEIYLPISSALTLGMFCPSYKDNLHAIYQNNALLRSRGIPEIVPPKGTKAQIDELMKGIETGAVVSTVKENVVNLNSLQIAYSSRFIYASTDDFDLVRDMIKEDPRLKKGMHLKVS